MRCRCRRLGVAVDKEPSCAACVAAVPVPAVQVLYALVPAADGRGLEAGEVARHGGPGHVRHDGGDVVGAAREVGHAAGTPPRHGGQFRRHGREDEHAHGAARDVLGSRLARPERQAGERHDRYLGKHGDGSHGGCEVVARAGKRHHC